MNSRFAVLLFVGLSFAIDLANAASEFKYKIPDGWWDLREVQLPGPGQKSMDNVPLKITMDATSGAYAIVAIDPQSTKFNRVGAAFNAVEAPTTGRITLQEMERFAPALIDQFKTAGLTASIFDVKVADFNGVKVGVTRFYVSDEKESDERTMVQYIIPGRKSAAVLTYSTPKADFNRFAATFEASARATKGGYEPGKFSYVRMVEVGGSFGLIAIFVMLMRGRRQKAAARADAQGGVPGTAVAPPPAAEKKKTSKYTWDCPGCGNPVPSRLEQCRCGTAKPT
jgi:hypothetical protein